MNTEYFARLRRVFEHAEDLPAAQRDAYLDEACGEDAELREEVVRMLAAEDATGFLVPLDEPSDAEEPDLRLPDQVGNFEVLGLLGQGGFGVVYRARQRAPVERVLALKVLHPRRLDAASRLRFEAERRSLALMQHSGIAQVFDAGVTDDGLHYLAMELVEGKPITAWCDDHELGIDERLELFLRVCAAVQHAHQRGVVHRDLKPSNVLVKDEGGLAVSKVIDFGVAKLLESESEAELTHDGTLVGTPGYMSPEQAAGGAVDTRTDVHALGVLLYDLLTGDLPFARKRMSSVGAVEAARIVREEEPRRLTTGAREASDGLDAVARRRGCDGANLVRSLGGDLEWIVRKALAKDPDERYASVSALIADVTRYRRDEPVEAREPAALYLARKFVTRHRFGVTLGAVAALTLLVGIVGLIWALEEVRAARDLAGAQRDAAVLSEYAARLSAARAALEIGDASIARRYLIDTDASLRGWEWRHLAVRCDGSERAFDLGSGVFAVLWLEDRRALAFQFGSAVVVDVETGEVQQVQTSFDDRFAGYAVHRATGRLVVNTRLWLELWDLDLERPPQRLFEVVNDVRSMAIAPDGRTLVTTENGGIARRFDLEGERPPQVLYEGDAFAWQVAFFDEGQRLITGMDGGRVEVRDAESGALEYALTLHQEGVKALAVSPDDRVLFAAAGDSLQSWDLSSHQRRDERDLEVEIGRLALSPDGQVLYGCGGWQEGRLVAWDVETLEVLSRFHGHRLGVTNLDIRADGAQLLSVSTDATLRVWPARAPPSFHLLDAGYDARSLTVAPDGEAFAAADVRGRVFVWNARTLALERIDETGERLTGCALGRKAIFVASDRLLAIDRKSGATREGEAPPSQAGRLLLDPEERWLAGTATEGLCLWRLPELELVHLVDVPETRAIAWDAQRGVILAGGTDGVLRSVDPISGAVRASREVSEVIWDLDSRQGAIAAVFDHPQWRVGWTPNWSAPLSELDRASVACVAFSPDGERLAVGGSDTLLSLWDLRDNEVLVLDDAPKPFASVAFALEGQRILALSHLPGSPSYVAVWTAPPEVELGD